MHSHAQHFEYHNHDNDHGNHHANRSDRSILVAFILSLIFSVVELIGGIVTGSAAITSDSVHSFGDALSTGISFIFEHLSHRRIKHGQCYSLIGAGFATAVLFLASAILIYEGIERILDPAEINYDGMIIFAVLGIVFNFLAALVTRHGHSLNQKTVNLHMFEDCFAWLAVLLGAIVMRFTGIAIIDPILSIAVALFTLYYALHNTHALVATFRQSAGTTED